MGDAVIYLCVLAVNDRGMHGALDKYNHSSHSGQAEKSQALLENRDMVLLLCEFIPGLLPRLLYQ